MKKVVFYSQDGKLTWEPSHEIAAQIKNGPFEVSNVQATVLDVLSQFMDSVVVIVNVVATSDVSNPNHLRELLRQQGEALEKVVANHTSTSNP